MRNKIIGALGVLIIVFAVIGYFAFDNTVRQSSEMFGQEMAVFNKPIKAGQIISQADLTVKKIKREQLVPGALEASKMESLIGQVALIDMYPNEQIIPNRFVAKDKYYSNNTRLIAFPTTLIDTVAATVRPGNYVDIWVKPNPAYPAQNYKEPVKLFENVRIEGLKNEAGIDVDKVENGVPAIVIVRMTDEQIKLLKTYIPDKDVTAFITLYPNQVGKAIELGK